jgi:UDP-sugar pyrophosphorylase
LKLIATSLQFARVLFHHSFVKSLFMASTVDSNFFSSVPALHSNLGLLSPDQIELAKILLENGQSHLFQQWPELGVDDKEKLAFFDQIARLNSSYPGGLAAYIKTAKELLADSKVGKNPYDGFSPSVPSGENLTFGTDNFIEMEKRGVVEARNAAFVLVAGGLGERLGYNGIKVHSEQCFIYLITYP